ncbi:MAG: serine/threonine-protein phosphatase [Planctomycetes bacterium]|nr:serine/threonine-protein phosphatase [Planctomycetota bacterium]
MDKKPVNWQTFIEYAELTDQGLRRTNNQDSHGSVISSSESMWQRRGHLFMVADGMGAHAAGELASKIAVDTVRLSYFKLPDASAPVALKKSIEEANSNIHTRGESNPDFRGMGTTSSVLALLPQGALVGHVGDSRAYRLRGNRIEQLSADHSLVWEMMAANRLSERDLPNYIPKNVITRSLGPNENVQVDLEGFFPLVEGDTFLLCSDGLSGQVEDEELGVILQALRPADAVRVLVELANLRGGPDNITVIVVKVVGAPLVSSSAASNSDSGAPKSPGSAVTKVLWAVCALAILGAMGFGVAGLVMFAGALGLLGGAMGLFALVWRSQVAADQAPVANTGGMLGRGPHRSLVCDPTLELLKRWNQLIEPVCQTARNQQWEIDWEKFEGLKRRAQTAAEQQQYLVAAREFCFAIIALMGEVRSQRYRRGSGSAG